MIFANVLDWVITEGSVKRVTDSLGNILWEKQTPPAEYFYVEDASGSANTLTIKKNVGNSTPTITVYYSTDQTNWSLLGNTSTTGLTLNIPADSKVYLKATTNSWTVAGANNNNWIGCSADFNIGGNIMSLIAGNNYRNATLIDGTNDYAFSCVFENDNYLVDTSNLILPNTVSNNCYREMFYMCDNLLTAPALPATTLATWCYYWMFYDCTSLTTAPALPATTLTNRCYDSMFFGCTSLTSAPALPATTLADYCYDCMFFGCTSLTSAPALPATTLADYCYLAMFANTAITTAPDLPATTLTTSCYSQMFNSCSNLNYIKIYADDITASNCLASWLQNVAATGDFYNEGSATYPVNSASGIPTGWTEHKTITNEYFYVEDVSGSDNTLSIVKNHNSAPSITVYKSTDQTNWTTMGTTSKTPITATVPANGKLYLKVTTNTWCNNNYRNVITCSDNYNVGGNIMSLIYGDNFENKTTFPSGSSKNLRYLFRSSTTIKNASSLLLPATTLTEYCYDDMFYNCTALTTAPVLPATTLANYCYANMFQGCKRLNRVITYADNISATNCINYWLDSVSATGDFYNLGSATYPSGVSGIPEGWTEHNTL